MRTSDISSEQDDPNIRSGSSYSTFWYSADSDTDRNLLSIRVLSKGWTGVGGVNEGPAVDDEDGGGDVVVAAVVVAAVVIGGDATVAIPPPLLFDVVGICSMTTFIRLLLEGRRSPFFFNLPIFARGPTQHTRNTAGRTATRAHNHCCYCILARQWPVRDFNGPSSRRQRQRRRSGQVDLRTMVSLTHTHTHAHIHTH